MVTIPHCLQKYLGEVRLHPLTRYLSPVNEKANNVVLNRSDTNRAVKAQLEI